MRRLPPPLQPVPHVAAMSTHASVPHARAAGSQPGTHAATPQPGTAAGPQAQGSGVDATDVAGDDGIADSGAASDASAACSEPGSDASSVASSAGGGAVIVTGASLRWRRLHVDVEHTHRALHGRDLRYSPDSGYVARARTLPCRVPLLLTNVTTWVPSPRHLQSCAGRLRCGRVRQGSCTRPACAHRRARSGGAAA